MRHTFRANVPMYELEVDRDKAKQLGLNFGEVFLSLQAQLGGIYINDFSQFGRAYRVMLEGEERFRQRPEDLRNFQVRSAAGVMVPVSTVAELRPTEGPTRLQGFNLSRSVTINGEPAQAQPARSVWV